MKVSVTKRVLIVFSVVFLIFINFGQSVYAKDWILSSTDATDSVVYIDVKDSSVEGNYHFSIFDSGKNVDKNDNELYNISVKDQNKILSPGQSGEFRFILDNISEMDINVELYFSEKNEYSIPIKYKLRKITGDNSDYLFGGEDRYESISSGKKLEFDLEKDERSEYLLYWCWETGSDADNEYENNLLNKANEEDLFYTIDILIYAEEKVFAIEANTKNAAIAGLVFGGGCACTAGTVMMLNLRYLKKLRD